MDEIYVVVAGDSLPKIAKRAYGDANKWRKILEANKDLNPDAEMKDVHASP